MPKDDRSKQVSGSPPHVFEFDIADGTALAGTRNGFYAPPSPGGSGGTALSGLQFGGLLQELRQGGYTQLRLVSRKQPPGTITTIDEISVLPASITSVIIDRTCSKVAELGPRFLYKCYHIKEVDCSAIHKLKKVGPLFLQNASSLERLVVPLSSEKILSETAKRALSHDFQIIVQEKPFEEEEDAEPSKIESPPDLPLATGKNNTADNMEGSNGKPYVHEINSSELCGHVAYESMKAFRETLEKLEAAEYTSVLVVHNETGNNGLGKKLFQPKEISFLPPQFTSVIFDASTAERVTYLPSRFLYKCTGLRTVDISALKNLNEIAGYFMSGCDKLKTIRCAMGKRDLVEKAVKSSLFKVPTIVEVGDQAECKMEGEVQELPPAAKKKPLSGSSTPRTAPSPKPAPKRIVELEKKKSVFDLLALQSAQPPNVFVLDMKRTYGSTVARAIQLRIGGGRSAHDTHYDTLLIANPPSLDFDDDKVNGVDDGPFLLSGARGMMTFLPSSLTTIIFDPATFGHFTSIPEKILEKLPTITKVDCSCFTAITTIGDGFLQNCFRLETLVVPKSKEVLFRRTVVKSLAHSFRIEVVDEEKMAENANTTTYFNDGEENGVKDSRTEIVGTDVKASASPSQHEAECGSEPPAHVDPMPIATTTSTNVNEAPSAEAPLPPAAKAKEEESSRSTATAAQPPSSPAPDDPTSNAEPSVLPTSSRYPWFQLGERVGRGGFGQVFKTLDLRTAEYLVAKEMITEHARDVKLVEKEIGFLSRLNHPNIVKFRCAERYHDDKTVLIFMEWMSGGSLSTVIRETGYGLYEFAIRNFMKDIVSGLAYLHAQRVVHRDVKPGNLLLSGNVVKLADFGISTVVSTVTRTSQTGTVGTPAYLAPEAIRDSNFSMASDVWAFACTVCAMACGRDPWHHLNISDTMPLLFHIGVKAQPPNHHPQIPSHLSSPLQDILEKCFAYSPDERLTMGELLQHPYLVGNQQSIESLGGESFDAFVERGDHMGATVASSYSGGGVGGSGGDDVSTIQTSPTATQLATESVRFSGATQ